VDLNVPNNFAITQNMIYQLFWKILWFFVSPRRKILVQHFQICHYTYLSNAKRNVNHYTTVYS